MNPPPGAFGKFEIIGCINLGGDYRKIVVTHPDVPVDIAPGTCAVVNGRWMAIAGSSNNRLHFVVKVGSWIFREVLTTIDLPAGKGFPLGSFEPAYVVAGGCGVGALTKLLSERQRLALPVRVFVFHRGFDEETFIREFPMFSRAIFWNTSRSGRPEQKHLSLYPASAGHDVFVAGPKSLVDAVRHSVEELNCKLHTNF